MLSVIVAHGMVGALLAVVFVLYYVQGKSDNAVKVIIELVLGIGGNVGAIRMLDPLMREFGATTKLYAIATCIGTFLLFTFVLLVVSAFVIKGRNDDKAIRLRDIFLGQYWYINDYYKQRSQEMNQKLQKKEVVLKNREKTIQETEAKILSREKQLEVEIKQIEEEKARLEQLGKKKPRMYLPEKGKVALDQEYVDMMPSYVESIYNCIRHIESRTDEFISSFDGNPDETKFRRYLMDIATHVSIDLFGTNRDGRVHFRIYDRKKNGYEKYVALIGDDLVVKPMTFIPYNETNMIVKSYECRRALIKSLNTEHDYESKNYKIWKEYLTYTFTDLIIEGKPILSFGISIKNVERYKKMLQFFNFFQVESYLQLNIERVNKIVNIESILYGGVK